MGITIKDVAKLAGVSISTTSLAINNQPGVKEETRQRILAAVQKLNYHPNRIAQGLVKKKTNNIDVIVSGPKYGYFSSPILFEVIKGIAEVINDSGYHLVLKVTTAEEEVDFIEEQINNRGCDGMIFWGTRMSEEKFADLCQGRSPVVAVARYVQEQTDFLGDGRRSQGRLPWYETPAGIGPPPDRLHREPARHQFGRGPIPRLQESVAGIRRGDRPQSRHLRRFLPRIRLCGDERDPASVRERGLSAVFAASDLMALGAIKAIIEAGLRVPDDISIVGFDNMPNADLLMVPLTTIATPIHKLGETAAIKLLKLLRKEQVEDHTKLDVELVVRKSTAKYPRTEPYNLSQSEPKSVNPGGDRAERFPRFPQTTVLRGRNKAMKTGRVLIDPGASGGDSVDHDLRRQR